MPHRDVSMRLQAASSPRQPRRRVFQTHRGSYLALSERLAGAASFMKAIYIKQHGAVEDLKVGDVPVPSIRPGEVLVKVAAAGINPSDLASVRGKFADSVLPRIVGRDFAGKIVEGPAELLGTEVWGTGGGSWRSLCYRVFCADQPWATEGRRVGHRVERGRIRWPGRDSDRAREGSSDRSADKGCDGEPDFRT